jgi:hypothetical protein
MICFLLSYNLSGQSENKACFSSVGSLESFNQIFHPLIDNKDFIVLLGESHGVAENYLLYINTIKSLNAKGNFRILVCERSYSEALLFNNFLITGNDEYLKWDVSYSPEMIKFFHELYEYNLSLPQNQRLVFFGVDAIHSIHAFVAGIQTLMPNDTAPNEISHFIDSLKTQKLPIPINPKSSKEYFALLDASKKFLGDEIKNNENLYRAYFGENYSHLDFIVKSESTCSKPISRNQNMFENISSIVKGINFNSSLIGIFFGETHLIQMKSVNKSFSSLLMENNESPFKMKTINILIEYVKSKTLFQNKVMDVPSLMSEILSKKEREQLNSFVEDYNCRDNILLKVPDQMNALKRNGQYLIVLNNAKPISIDN